MWTKQNPKEPPPFPDERTNSVSSICSGNRKNIQAESSGIYLGIEPEDIWLRGDLYDIYWWGGVNYRVWETEDTNFSVFHLHNRVLHHKLTAQIVVVRASHRVHGLRSNKHINIGDAPSSACRQFNNITGVVFILHAVNIKRLILNTQTRWK